MICRGCHFEHPAGVSQCSRAKALRDLAERNAQVQHVAQPAPVVHVEPAHVAQSEPAAVHVAQGNAGRCKAYRQRNASAETKAANRDRMREARDAERKARQAAPSDGR